MITSAQVVESRQATTNSLFQDYIHQGDHTSPTYVVLYFALILVNLKYYRPKTMPIKNDEKYPFS